MENESSKPVITDIKRPEDFLAYRKENITHQVYVLRDWKEYAGEGLLILFSVFLGLFLNEWVSRLNDHTHTNELVQTLITELKSNKQIAREQYDYDTQVLATIDSALHNPSIQKEFLVNDEINLNRFAPLGILHLNLSSTAWEVAKQQNIASRIDIAKTSLLTSCYADQARIPRLEEEIAKVIFSRDSRKMENIHTTLVLIRDNYKGWAYDRLPGLMMQYDTVIALLEKQH